MRLALGLLVFGGAAGCASTGPTAGGEVQMTTYTVKRASGPVKINAQWDKALWQRVAPADLLNFMGTRPSHFPKVQAKVAYDDAAVYVIFRVEDSYVRAVADRHDGGGVKDSCVEFFFTPGTDLDRGYFNLEMNCGGTMLFHHQMQPRKNSVGVTSAEIDKIEVAHTMPRIVKPEVAEPPLVVEYRLPFEIISKYHPVGTASRPRA